MARGTHVRPLRLAVDEHVDAKTLLDADAVRDVRVDGSRVLLVVNLASLEGSAGGAEGCCLGEAADRRRGEGRHLQHTN